jgi:hypothetical protein
MPTPVPFNQTAMPRSSEVQSGGAKTIPELREAFERIETFAKDLVQKGGSVKTMSRDLATEWKAVFGRKIGGEAAEEYLKFIGGEKAPAPAPVASAKNKTRKAHKMKGGATAAPIAGAPLDYQTRPGIDGPYGNFPPYVDGGFGVGVPAISQNYIMTPKAEVTIDAGDGGNRPLQTGGAASKKRTAKRKLRGAAARRTLRGGSKFILSAAPTTALQDAVTAWRGQTLPVSPDPTSTAFKL